MNRGRPPPLGKLLSASPGSLHHSCRCAAAFAEAKANGAFLVFDKADSLLGDRIDAVRNWKVTQVNEMLTWMEQHPLPFACTTNLPNRLDPASLRRFLIKPRFTWLTAVQARLAWYPVLNQRAAGRSERPVGAHPGRFRPHPSPGRADGRGRGPAALLRRLQQECMGRDGTRGSIGSRPD